MGAEIDGIISGIIGLLLVGRLLMKIGRTGIEAAEMEGFWELLWA